MSVNVNLLREKQMQAIERQRDPFKIVLLAVLLGALGLVGYYLIKANGANSAKSRLSNLKSEWSKTEPKLLAAEARKAELDKVLAEAQGLQSIMTDRFYWSYFLAVITNNLSPNVTLSSLNGSTENMGTLNCKLSGVIASATPRQAADELRVFLQDKLMQAYATKGAGFNVTVSLPQVEDESNTFDIDGETVPSASFTLSITLSPKNP